MNTNRYHRARMLTAVLAVTGLGTAVPLMGCGGGGEAGMAVRRPATQRPDIDRAMVSKGAMKLPTDAPFNITSFRSGQDGAARGDARSVGRNGAACEAETKEKGSAWGEFQLGYCFDNTTEMPLNAIIKLHLSATEAGSTGRAGDTRPTNGHATAGNNLKFFVKDTYGVLLKQETLVSSNMERGPSSAVGSEELFFDVRFEPKRGYYLVIAGRAEAQSADGELASASLEVTDCVLEIDWGSVDGS